MYVANGTLERLFRVYPRLHIERSSLEEVKELY